MNIGCDIYIQVHIHVMNNYSTVEVQTPIDRNKLCPVTEEPPNYSPIRNLAILADFVCIITSNSRHSRDGGSVRDNANEGIMHTMFARIVRFRIRES